MTIYQQLKQAEIPVSSHCSDLYCKVTTKSTQILKTYEFNMNVTTFISNNDGTLWYDIPFANDLYYASRPTYYSH